MLGTCLGLGIDKTDEAGSLPMRCSQSSFEGGGEIEKKKRSFQHNMVNGIKWAHGVRKIGQGRWEGLKGKSVPVRWARDHGILSRSKSSCRHTCLIQVRAAEGPVE